jgi:predicted polyphosphate/ATP-dependent NAD kinase
LALLAGKARATIIVTPIGGQGAILGRGNQQISPKVIRMVGPENIVIISTKEKLYALGNQPLWTDTGDPDIDRALTGYRQVVTGFREKAVRKVGAE